MDAVVLEIERGLFLLLHAGQEAAVGVDQLLLLLRRVRPPQAVA